MTLSTTNIFPRDKKFTENVCDDYKEVIPRLPASFAGELNVPVEELPWFDGASRCKHKNIRYISSSRGNPNLDIFENRRQGNPQEFMVVWTCWDIGRKVRRDTSYGHGSLDDGYQRVHTVLGDKMSKSGAQKLALRFAKLITTEDEADLKRRTLDTPGTLCKGRIGWPPVQTRVQCRIGDIVKYNNGGKDCGWLYQIVSEVQGLGHYRDHYDYKICAVFTGFRGLKQPNPESVAGVTIKPVDITELGKVFSELKDLINVHLKQNGVKAV